MDSLRAGENLVFKDLKQKMAELEETRQEHTPDIGKKLDAIHKSIEHVILSTEISPTDAVHLNEIQSEIKHFNKDEPTNKQLMLVSNIIDTWKHHAASIEKSFKSSNKSNAMNQETIMLTLSVTKSKVNQGSEIMTNILDKETVLAITENKNKREPLLSNINKAKDDLESITQIIITNLGIIRQGLPEELQKDPVFTLNLFDDFRELPAHFYKFAERLEAHYKQQEAQAELEGKEGIPEVEEEQHEGPRSPPGGL